MVEARCVKKYRDNSNKIVGYLIQSEDGLTRMCTPYEIKYLILTNQIHIVNLKLSSNDRIIDDNSYKSHDNVKDRMVLLVTRISEDTGLQFNPNISTVRCNDKDFYIVAEALGNTPLRKIGLKSNRNIIKIACSVKDNNGKYVNKYKHVKFDKQGYNTIVSIINSNRTAVNS